MKSKKESGYDRCWQRGGSFKNIKEAVKLKVSIIILQYVHLYQLYKTMFDEYR